MGRLLYNLIPLLFLGTSVVAAEPVLRPGTYSLRATFDVNGEAITFFHDVNVRRKSGKVTIAVLKDIAPQKGEEQPREKLDDAESISTGGFGGGVHREWRSRPVGQDPWLKRGRKFYGAIEEEKFVRFGFTCVRNGRLVSLHFVGRPSEKGAIGKVQYLSEDMTAVEGEWELYHPDPESLPIGPALKGVPLGR